MRRSLASRSGVPGSRRLMAHYADPQEGSFVYTGPRKFLKPLRVHNTGVRILHDPIYNKGTAFDYVERDVLRLRGLLPPCHRSLKEQAQRSLDYMNKLDGPLMKNLFLQDLQNRNETLYFKLLVDNLSTIAPLVYTPTVGHVCQKFGSQFMRARGMYFSKYDRGHFSTMIHNWPFNDVHCVVVTDGSRVLGLGDLGVNGMGISIGKLALYVAAGGIAPHRVLPVVLDVGTNNVELREDPEYMGIREPRLEGEEYMDMVDEFMAAVSYRFPNSLVQFEDFESKKAVPLLERYRNKYRMFNDDIQGTGAVTLAGCISAVQISGCKVQDVRVLCAGAGSAGMGVCNQLLEGMVAAGVPRTDARKNFVLMTNLGVLGVPDNAFGNPNHTGSAFVQDHLAWINPAFSDGLPLLDAIKQFRPNVLLGLSTAGGLFNEEVVRLMSEINERPIIMPMSNPTSRAECTPEQAYLWSDGRAIVATGSPFETVTLPDGRKFVPSQCNNMYVFPGLGLAASVSGVRKITDQMLYEAALAIAGTLSKEEKEEGRTFPHIDRIRDVTVAVAKAVILEGKKRNLLLPSKIDFSDEIELEALIRRKLYLPYYTPMYPDDTK